MRELKFRVWDKVLRCWSGNSMNWLYGKCVVYPDCGDRYIFVQFTGLTDKNGKEIYEGDIVRHKGPFQKEPERSICDFHEGAFRFMIFDKKEDFHPSSSIYCEIIGNIYENSELLEPNRQ